MPRTRTELLSDHVQQLQNDVKNLQDWKRRHMRYEHLVLGISVVTAISALIFIFLFVNTI